MGIFRSRLIRQQRQPFSHTSGDESDRDLLLPLTVGARHPGLSTDAPTHAPRHRVMPREEGRAPPPPPPPPSWQARLQILGLQDEGPGGGQKSGLRAFFHSWSPHATDRQAVLEPSSLGAHRVRSSGQALPGRLTRDQCPRLPPTTRLSRQVTARASRGSTGDAQTGDGSEPRSGGPPGFLLLNHLPRERGGPVWARSAPGSPACPPRAALRAPGAVPAEGPQHRGQPPPPPPPCPGQGGSQTPRTYPPVAARSLSG